MDPSFNGLLSQRILDLLVKKKKRSKKQVYVVIWRVFLGSKCQVLLWKFSHLRVMKKMTTSTITKQVGPHKWFAIKLSVIDCWFPSKRVVYMYTVHVPVYRNWENYIIALGTRRQTQSTRRQTQSTFNGFIFLVKFTAIGDMYIWGWNESGQLGLPPDLESGTEEGSSHVMADQISFQMVPAILDLPGGVNVSKVSCGSRHTAAVSCKYRKHL